MEPNYKNEPIIKVENLTRNYGKFTAVDDISFEVKKGEIFGFLGPNGAGKTTTIMVLTGQLPPTSGNVTVCGLDVVKKRRQLYEKIGIIFEEQNLYSRLSVFTNLNFFAKLYGKGKDRVYEVLDIVGLIHKKNETVMNLSKGLKQRLLIARGLLPEPQVLFMDEPTSGLDPHSARALRDLIKGFSENGMTIFLTTHYMDEADWLCSRVAIIDKGKIIAQDSPKILKNNSRKPEIEITIQKDGIIQNRLIGLDEENEKNNLAGILSEGKILDIKSHQASLEDVFLELTGKPFE